MAEKLRTVLVLASTFPRWEADTEPRFVFDLCVRLQGSFNVILLAPHARGAQEREIMEGIRVHRYRYAPARLERIAYAGGIVANLKKNKANLLLLPFFFLAQGFAIWKLLRSNDVDVIHAHWLLPQGLLAVVSRAFSKSSPPILCTSHGGDLFGLRDPLSTSLKRWVIKRCEGLTTVSSAMAEKVSELANDMPLNLHVIPMGTDLNRVFVTNPYRDRKSNQLLFVGRLVPKKGLIHLIEILPKIKAEYPDVSLNIVGLGPEKNRLVERIAELDLEKVVVFLGSLSHTELKNLYQESSLAVFPFVEADDGDMEGLGLVTVESLGCSCPVVVGDVPAVKDVIEDEETGLIVDVRDANAFEAAVGRMLSDQSWAGKTASKGNEFVIGSFDWSIVASKYDKLLHDMTMEF
ncbi:MAG: glycosyltransferase family 4 protein [Halioglobus sp.]